MQTFLGNKTEILEKKQLFQSYLKKFTNLRKDLSISWEVYICRINKQAYAAAAAAAKSLQSCPTLCNPIDGSPSGPTVPGILQARTLEWVAISFSNMWKWKVKVKSLSRVWLSSDPMDCSLPGSSIHGIFQARVLEWVASAFSEQAYVLTLILIYCYITK